MNEKLLMGLIVIGVMCGQGCSYLGGVKRDPARDVGIVSPVEDEVVFLYKENDQIVLKQCELGFQRILKGRSDCPLKSGTQEKRFSVEDFKDLLRMSLRISQESHRDEMKQKNKPLPSTGFCSYFRGEKRVTEIMGGQNRNFFGGVWKRGSR